MLAEDVNRRRRATSGHRTASNEPSGTPFLSNPYSSCNISFLPQEKDFTGDLLPNGAIRWTETKQLFSTPSAWVNYCRRSVDPNSVVKAASAWSTIRYKGKRLDSYKLRWYRRQKKIISNANMMEQSKSTADARPSVDQIPNVSRLTAGESEMLKSQNVMEHAALGLRSQPLTDPSLMIRCTPFSAMERIQPFTINVATNALLLVDFHCHLTDGEVTGYLSGSWDFSTHCLTILQAFPCRSRLGDKKRSALVEEEIRTNMEQRNLTLVGWYHSHARTAAHPTIKDIENQLDYQIAMKGESDTSYTPCVGLICSPYDKNNSGAESSMQLFWVMPPPEYRPYEYGRPMQMLFSATRDSYLTQDLLLEMVCTLHQSECLGRLESGLLLHERRCSVFRYLHVFSTDLRYLSVLVHITSHDLLFDSQCTVQLR